MQRESARKMVAEMERKLEWLTSVITGTVTWLASKRNQISAGCVEVTKKRKRARRGWREVRSLLGDGVDLPRRATKRMKK